MKAIRGRRLKSIILDARGTCLDPFEDHEAHPHLLTTMAELLQHGVDVAIVTGCSIDTINKLMLTPLAGHLTRCNKPSGAAQRTSLYLYTGTGSEAYAFTAKRGLKRMRNYNSLVLAGSLLDEICTCLEEFAAERSLRCQIERRSGQVNFYTPGTWMERVTVRHQVKTVFAHRGWHNLHIKVPSGKSVIDITIATKARAAKDFTRRRLRKMRNEDVNLVISDSFQVDGADLDMLLHVPNAVGVHVGPMHTECSPGVLRVPGGPEATRKVLTAALNHVNGFASFPFQPAHIWP